MDLRQIQRLRAEISKLDSMLARIPVNHVIDRMSFEERRAQIVQELEGYENIQTDIQPTKLTFRGNPVKNQQGIAADFVGDVIGRFNTAVEAMGASSTRELRSRGAIPGAQNYSLMITGVARGSFGFQLERACDQLVLISDEDPVTAAIDRIKNVMKATLLSDDELVDTLAATDRRAVTDIRNFLDAVVKHKATFAIESNRTEFRFETVDQIERGAARLQESNLLEKAITLSGEFIGYLPESQEAEFRVTRLTDEDAEFVGEIVDTIIKAKVDVSLEDANSINHILEQDISIIATAKRIGESKPSYVIQSFGTLMF